MSSTIENPSVDNEYHWKYYADDGLRSYSFDASNPNWNYAKYDGTEDLGDGSDEYYIFTDSSTGKPSARRGNLYNFTAATLGSSLNLVDDFAQAPDSLCPRGWQLPNDSGNKSFFTLFGAYGITSNIASYNRIVDKPLEYLPTGYYDYDGYVSGRTTYGNWWASVGDNDDGYMLSTYNYSPFVSTQSMQEACYGHALRCVAPRQSLHHHEVNAN